MSFRQSGIPGILLTDYGMATGVEELVSPGGRVIVAIEPICDFLVVPPLFTETAYRVKQELLILRIGCYPEICYADRQGKGEIDIYVRLVGFLPPSKTIPQ